MPKSKELVIMDIEDIERPHVVDVKKLSSRQLKICFRTGVVQKPDGTVYFTGGMDEGRGKVHNLVEIVSLALCIRYPPGYNEPAGRYALCEGITRNLLE